MTTAPENLQEHAPLKVLKPTEKFVMKKECLNTDTVLKIQDATGQVFFIEKDLPGRYVEDLESYTCTTPDGQRRVFNHFALGITRERCPSLPFSINFLARVNGDLLFFNPSADDIELSLMAKKEMQEKQQHCLIVPPGNDGEIEGLIHGHSFYALTQGVCGGEGLKEFQGNQDSVAVNPHDGSFVVTDGIGGSYFAAQAAFIAAQAFVKTPSGTPHGKAFVAMASIQAAMALFPEGFPSGTTLTGLQLQGNRLDTVVFGNSRWVLVRQGKIMARSLRHIVPEDAYLRGELSEEEMLSHSQYSELTSHLPYGFDPDHRYLIAKDEHWHSWEICGEALFLKEGDVVVVLSDGGDCLSDEDILQAVHEKTPQETAYELRNTVARYNDQQTLTWILANAKKIERHAPQDNFTCLVMGFGLNVASILEKRAETQSALPDVDAGSAPSLGFTREMQLGIFRRWWRSLFDQ